MMKRLNPFALLRWQYVVPRASIVLALVLAVRFGLDPLLHRALVASGETALGAKVEIAQLTTSLRGGELVITGLAAANPHKPLRNLLEAEEVRLHVDPGQLLRKRVVVRGGRLTGLRFDAPRAASGALESAPLDEALGPSLFDPALVAAEEQAIAWFNDLSGRIEQDLMASLATPRLAQELEERWPRQYESLKARAEDLRAKTKQIEITFRDVKKNPLRNLEKIEELQSQLAATQTQLSHTLAEIKTLPNQAKADRAAIDAARKQDEQFLRQHLRPGSVNAEQLSRYLLGGEAAEYLSQTTAWIQRIKRLIPKSKIAPPSRLRGTNVLFVDRRLPRYLVERVELAGSARLDGQALTFVGALTDATTEPALHSQPLRLRLTGAGALPFQLTAQLDRRGETPHDWLVLDCPKLQLAHRTLGKADKLAVTVAPGEASLHAEVKLDGDQLTGVIELRQATTLAAATPMLRDDRIAQVLHESLRGVDRLEATIQLTGTLTRPNGAIQSNLGPQLAAGVNGAVGRYLADRKERLMAKVEGRVDEQLAKLDAARRQAQAELLAKLGQDQQLVAQLGSLMSGKPSLEGIGIPQLGRALDKLQR